MSAFIAGVVATLAVLVLVRLRRRLARFAPRSIARAVARRRDLNRNMRWIYVTLTASCTDDITGQPPLVPGPIYRNRAASLPRPLRRIVRHRLRDYYLSDPEISAEWPWAGAR